jgi:GcrA cell cycle regulator
MPKMHAEGWTEERVERLKKLWAEGFSANDIAMEIRHVSRNAVIGKIHRLKLPKREVRASPRPGSVVKHRVRPRLRTVFDATPLNTDALEEVFMANTGIPKVKQMRAIAEETRAAPVIKAATLPAPVPGLAPLNLSLLELGPTSCRYACNDAKPGETHLFCGHERRPESPYCEFHHARCYAGVSTRRPALPMRRAA